MRLKPLGAQTLVLTGASSGIGLATARRAAARGARLLLVARDAGPLARLCDEIAARGGEAAFLATDVADEAGLRAAAQLAVERFGGFDTWVNGAGVILFGRNEDVARADQRRLFETNFWGVVNGSMVAVEHLRRRGGGALINIGSQLSDHAAPLMGAYVAAKHAVKGYTDSLRLELQRENAPISVTLVKPAAMDTPIARHGKSTLAHEPRLPPPLYAPQVAAAAILSAAEHPQRDVYVGAAARVFSMVGQGAPAVSDAWMEAVAFGQVEGAAPARPERRDNLHRSQSELQERGGLSAQVHESSLYTAAATGVGRVAGTAFGRLGAVGAGALARALSLMQR